MRKIAIIFFLLFFLLTDFRSYATHARAGEITYQLKPGSANCYIITVTLYTWTDSPVNNDSIEIIWGDNTQGTIPRITPRVDIGNETFLNIYQGEHCYNTAIPWTYIISVSEPNRMADIININNANHGNPVNPASQSVVFYIESSLSTVQYCGSTNNSPVLLDDPIDFANIGEVFKHNPNPYDLEGDSFSFDLVVPKQGPGLDVPLYEFPDSVYDGYNDSFIINHSTGQITWTTPQIAGIYAIAIKITEWRRCGNTVFEVGYIIRDMQIIVKDVNNTPPEITEIRDTCVVAGSSLSQVVVANDKEINQIITLTAEGGPMELSSGNATFPTVTGNGTVSSTFNWQTSCDHIRKTPWIVVFRAVDNFSPTPLADLYAWQIRVVGPPPQNLQANASGNDIKLTWDSLYQCASTGKFKGFSVWRKEGCDTFTPGPCDIGLEGKGYVNVTFANLIQDYYYVDKNLDRGKVYTYRVLAIFAEGAGSGIYNVVESIPSGAVCAELKLDVPVIINVSVTKTDLTNGEIFVRWKKPKADVLDTLQNPPPYRYEIFRFPDSVRIKTVTANSFYELSDNISDTTVYDSGLNTEMNSYTYKVDFYSNSIYLGNTGKASSVFLSIIPDDKKLHLSWTYKTPWENDSFIVYRLDTPAWIPLDTVYTNNYSDYGLLNGKQYCYYVKSFGHYSDTNIPDTIINDSEIKCSVPQDTVPPCPPVLSVINYCDKYPDGNLQQPLFYNNLIWTLIQNSCSDETAGYHIYYSPKEDTALALIDSSSQKVDTTYEHSTLMNTLAGCYAITALDTFGNESIYSNTVCVDNCPLYDLPNVFTPNGDGHNDFFTPFEFLESKEYAARFIDHVDMKIYNRWGQMVFKTENPIILWDGKDFRVNKDLAEGVYFYVCEIYEIRLKGIEKRDKLKSGYIHILR